MPGKRTTRSTRVPAKIGRPTKFSPEWAEAFCREIARGSYIAEICTQENQPSRETVYAWMREREDFSDMYARARRARRRAGQGNPRNRRCALRGSGCSSARAQSHRHAQMVGGEARAEEIRRSCRARPQGRAQISAGGVGSDRRRRRAGEDDRARRRRRRITMSDVLSIGQQSFWQKFGVACSGCPVAALDFTADCCWGRSGAARGSAFRHPLYALPQSFQNPSKRSERSSV